LLLSSGLSWTVPNNLALVMMKDKRIIIHFK